MISRLFGPRHTRSAAAVFLAVLLLSAGIYVGIRRMEPATAESEMDSGSRAEVGASTFASDVAIPVEGTSARRGTLMTTVTAAGQTAAWRQAIVTTQVTGRVVSVPVQENGIVAEGAALVVIDPVEYQLAVDEAEARVRTAQAQFEEMTLLDEEIADLRVRSERQRFAKAKSRLDEARVNLRRAQINLTRTRVGAPFAGRAASLKVVPGQWVRAGDELMTVVDLDPMKVEVQVLESEVGLLVAGGRATISLAAFPEESFGGTIQTINPIIERSTRTAKVTVLIPNSAGRTLPGMYATVSLNAREFPNRLLVPRSAVLERDRRNVLFTYEGNDQGGRAKWRYVTTGLLNDSLVEIIPGRETEIIEPGDTVLTGGHYTLIHDAWVRVVENAATHGGRPQ